MQYGDGGIFTFISSCIVTAAIYPDRSQSQFRLYLACEIRLFLRTALIQFSIVQGPHLLGEFPGFGSEKGLFHVIKPGIDDV